MSHLRAEMEGREVRLREELQNKEADHSRLMEELRMTQQLLQEGAGQVGCSSYHLMHLIIVIIIGALQSEVEMEAWSRHALCYE